MYLYTALQHYCYSSPLNTPAELEIGWGGEIASKPRDGRKLFACFVLLWPLFYWLNAIFGQQCISAVYSVVVCNRPYHCLIMIIFTDCFVRSSRFSWKQSNIPGLLQHSWCSNRLQSRTFYHSQTSLPAPILPTVGECWVFLPMWAQLNISLYSSD